MKQSEIKELSIADLKEKLEALKKNVADLKMAHSITPLENPLLIRTTRRSVARVQIELTKRIAIELAKREINNSKSV